MSNEQTADAERSATPPADPRLRLLIAAFAVLVGLGYIAQIFFARIISSSPEALIALSSRIRYLVLSVTADINPIAYSIVGFIRLAIAATLCYVLGYYYGDRAMAWFNRQLDGKEPMTFRWLKTIATKAGWLLALLFPGSNIACALIGMNRMAPRRFAMLISIGIAIRLAWVWAAAQHFDSELKKVLHWIERYQWYVVGAFFLITFVQAFFKASKMEESGISE
jgi:membrane protein DedA with SNARE-associated domain